MKYLQGIDREVLLSWKMYNFPLFFQMMNSMEGDDLCDLDEVRLNTQTQKPLYISYLSFPLNSTRRIATY